ncbi:MAG: hypothetical protein H0V44_15120 [Planctomycetes bacterium]|nr:hypothetical protein [Planctomycetota bacterium]
MTTTKILACASGALLSLMLSSAASAAENEALLFDFESPKQAFENADKMLYVPEHATQGAHAGKVTLDKPFDMNIGFWAGSNQVGKWDQYDQLVMDVFVDGGPAAAVGWVKDKDGGDWWKRFNFEYKLAPGKRRLTFSLGAFTRQNGQGNLDLKTIDFFALQFKSEDAAKPATVYLDNAKLIKGAGSFESKILYSFEGQDPGSIVLEDYPSDTKEKSQMTPAAEHPSHGAKALKLESHSDAGNVQFTGFDGDWSRYDSLHIDIFNPGQKPVKVGGWIRAGDPKADYWNRHNWDRILKPGFNSLRISTGAMSLPDGRGGNIDAAKVVSFNCSVDHQTILIDNIRLVKGVEEVAVEGLKRFDFGPVNSAVMPGFTKATSKNAYDTSTGFGWLTGAQFGRDFDMNEMLGRHRPPDDLCRDFVMPTKGTFAIDLPNGTYGIWLMMGPPGNGWGRTFKHRTVTANGKQVVDESFDLESFKKHEFMFQDSEDLPGDDLWTKYIDVLFKPALFDAEVTDGQLKLAFDGHEATWSAMVNGLAVWPKSQQSEAERWLANLSEARKEQYQAMHVEKLPEPDNTDAAKPSAEDQARGYLAFAHYPERRIDVNSQPTSAEAATRKLDIAATPGEYENVCLGLYPLADCGTLKLTMSDLTGPGGSVIPASAVSVEVARYKALNYTAVYIPQPKYLDKVPATGIAIKPGVTRSFWLILQVPAAAAAGSYAGALQLAWSNGKTDSIPVALTVYPIALAEADFPMGMFMVGPSQDYLGYDSTGEAYWAAWKEILIDARAHGQTSLDPLINVPMQRLVDGKAEIDFKAMDRFMKLAREAGFTQEIVAYGVSTGMQIRINQLDIDAEAKRFGATSYAQVAKAYFDAVREHSKQNNWLPITFCTDDEYIVHPNSDPAKLAELHKILQDAAPDFHFVAFDSAFYQKLTPEEDAKQVKMLEAIDTWGAGIHSTREAEITAKNRRRLWLYNTGMNRFTFGTYMQFARQKHGVSGFFQWIYPTGGTYGTYYLASHNEANYGVVYPSTHGLRTTPVWEQVRSGCDDHRYLQTAFQLIKRAKAAGKGANEAKELDATIEKTFKLLTFGNRMTDARSGEGKADNPIRPEAMEAFRRSVAVGIVKLQTALGGK